LFSNPGNVNVVGLGEIMGNIFLFPTTTSTIRPDLKKNACSSPECDLARLTSHSYVYSPIHFYCHSSSFHFFAFSSTHNNSNKIL
jgi:hypothetical protein